jgi:adenylate cyclase
VIEQRISRLDATQRTLLSAASVEGEIFTAQAIARVRRMEERLLLHLLHQELEKRHRLVQEHAVMRVGRQRLSRYRFAHALFQHYLYNRHYRK